MDIHSGLDGSKMLPRAQWDPTRQPVVLVLIGSFSPITYLHLRLFEMARDGLHDAAQHQVVGGFISPVHETYRKVGLAAAAHRLEMCRLAVADSDWIQVDDWEARQCEYQRTVSVLTSVQARLDRTIEGPQVMLLAGADLINSFAVPNLWSEEDRNTILRRFGCVVVDRWSSDISEFLLTDPILYAHRKRIHVVKQFISNDISATKIRLFISRGLSVKYLLPDSVIDYIRQNDLYREGVGTP